MPNPEVKVKLSANARGFNTSLKSGTQSVRKFSTSLRRSKTDLKRLNKTSLSTGRIFRGLGLAAASAFAIRATKKFLDFDRALRLTAATGNIVDKNLDELGRNKAIENFGKKIEKAATDSGQSRDEILEGVDAIIQRIGQADFAIDSAEAIGRISLATGAAGRDIGAIFADLRQKLGLSAEESERYFDILITQGKEGSFTLQRMSKELGPLLAQVVAFGFKGEKGFRRFGAFLQMAESDIRDTSKTAMSVKALIMDLTRNAAALEEELGIEVFEIDEKGFKRGRDLATLIQEITEATEADPEILQKFFNMRAIRAISSFTKAFRETGGFKEFDRLTDLGGDLSNLNKDFELVFDGGATKIQNFNTQLQKLVENLGKLPLDKFIDSIERLTEILDQISESKSAVTSSGVITTGLAALTGLLLARIIHKI